MTMNQSDWSSNDESDPQPDLSTSEDEESQPATLASRSRLRPAGSALAFVPYANWEPERSYDTEPTIRWNMEWKILVKNREQAGESELNIVISPRKFWKHVLRTKVADASANKPWKEDVTKLILSVTDRKTGKITKRYPKLGVDWSFVTKRLQEWSKFLNDGKKITITITFYYVYNSTDTSKPGRGGATANQEAELEARTAGFGRGACIRKAYALVRCPGPPCTKGSDHCWQNEGKHYPLRPHHVRMLAEHLQSGKALNGHDDVPDDFRQLVRTDEREQEERERKERQRQTRKRKRRDSDGSLHEMSMIRCHTCAPVVGTATNVPSTPRMVFPTSPTVELNLPRDDAVRAYNQWQRSQVTTEEQKQYYDMALELTLAHCYDLNVLAVNRERMSRFYTQHGIPDGIAWHYVCDIKSFVKQYETSNQ